MPNHLYQSARIALCSHREKAGAFYGKIDKITKILKQNFDRMIKHLGYMVNFEEIYMQAKAWDVVKRKCRENNDYVIQVCLTAKRDKENTNHSDYTRNSNINGFIEDGMENDAKEVFAGYKYDKNASDQSIRNTIDKVFYINQFIENNECEIKVKLSKSGIICLNEEVVPMYFLPERAIENFQIGSSISETEDVSTLEEWLKNSINDIKRTTDATTPPKNSQDLVSNSFRDHIILKVIEKSCKQYESRMNTMRFSTIEFS